MRYLATKHIPPYQMVLGLRLTFCQLVRIKNTLHGSKIDEDIGQGVEIGNGLLITQFGPFNAQGHCLTENAFNGRSWPVPYSKWLSFPSKDQAAYLFTMKAAASRESFAEERGQ
jgi:hypothetical protein